MFDTNIYNLEVQPGTRNHQGSFVREAIYKLVEIERAGWAFICQDDRTCHYVDPDSLHLKGRNH